MRAAILVEYLKLAHSSLTLKYSEFSLIQWILCNIVLHICLSSGSMRFYISVMKKNISEDVQGVV